MIHPRGESTRTLLEAVFSAEGSYFALAKIIKRASAVARSIFAILAAAPFFCRQQPIGKTRPTLEQALTSPQVSASFILRPTNLYKSWRKDFEHRKLFSRTKIFLETQSSLIQRALPTAKSVFPFCFDNAPLAESLFPRIR